MGIEDESNPEARFEALKMDGLQERFDADFISEFCIPEVLRERDRFNRADVRGEKFADYIVPTLLNSDDSLPIVFVGNSHIPILAERFDQIGFRPLITTSLTRENLEMNRVEYNTDNPVDFYGLVGTLGATDHYNFSERVFRGTQTAIFVGDSHGNSYEISLPKIETLQTLGIRNLQVFVEDEHKGPVTLEQLKAGFTGKKQLANVLEQYENAGIVITIEGIEDESYFRHEESGFADDNFGDFNDGPDAVSPSFSRRDAEKTKPTESRDIEWQQLIVDRGQSAEDIKDPKTWLEDQIKFYDGMGDRFTSTAQTYRNALKRLIEGQ